MLIKKQFRGYDCAEVDSYLRKLEEKKGQTSDLLFKQCLEQSKNNQELLGKIFDLSKRMEEGRQLEHNIAAYLLDQVKILEDACTEGQILVKQKRTAVKEQMQRIEDNKRLLSSLSHQIRKPL